MSDNERASFTAHKNALEAFELMSIDTYCTTIEEYAVEFRRKVKDTKEVYDDPNPVEILMDKWAWDEDRTRRFVNLICGH